MDACETVRPESRSTMLTWFALYPLCSTATNRLFGCTATLIGKSRNSIWMPAGRNDHWFGSSIEPSACLPGRFDCAPPGAEYGADGRTASCRHDVQATSSNARGRRVLIRIECAAVCASHLILSKAAKGWRILTGTSDTATGAPPSLGAARFEGLKSAASWAPFIRKRDRSRVGLQTLALASGVRAACRRFRRCACSPLGTIRNTSEKRQQAGRTPNASAAYYAMNHRPIISLD